MDDAYLYRFEEERLLLVVNAANTEKDLMHLRSVVKDYDCTITDITSQWASIAVQGPKSKDLLTTLSGGVQVTEPMKNALNTLTFEGHEVKVAKTGYTGEPLGYEVYCRSEDAAWLWNRLVELGARPPVWAHGTPSAWRRASPCTAMRWVWIPTGRGCPFSPCRWPSSP